VCPDNPAGDFPRTSYAPLIRVCEAPDWSQDGNVGVCMFTGIIQSLGTVRRVEAAPRVHESGAHAHRLEIDLGVLADGLVTGASVAVNGVCVTVAARQGSVASFDVVPETWSRTTLPDLRPGDPVHLERALRVGDPLDGHFVQGHVDGIGIIEHIARTAGEWKLWVSTGPEQMPCIVPKGSIALDGVSLTVVDAHDTRFSVALVPTTLERTTLARRRPGQRVNIETDIVARLVVAWLQRTATSGPASALTWQQLQAGGFVT